eukprot:Rmarinus@m.11062
MARILLWAICIFLLGPCEIESRTQFFGPTIAEAVSHAIQDTIHAVKLQQLDITLRQVFVPDEIALNSTFGSVFGDMFMNHHHGAFLVNGRVETPVMVADAHVESNRSSVGATVQAKRSKISANMNASSINLQAEKSGGNVTAFAHADIRTINGSLGATAHTVRGSISLTCLNTWSAKLHHSTLPMHFILLLALFALALLQLLYVVWLFRRTRRLAWWASYAFTSHRDIPGESSTHCVCVT